MVLLWVSTTFLWICSSFCDLLTIAMMLARQKRLNFLPEMQSKVTINCDNSSGTEYKHGVLGGYILKKQRKPT